MQVVRVAGGAAVHEAEVGAAVEHVQVDGPAELQELAHGVRQVLGVAPDDVLAPAVEPAVPELHAHERPVLAVLLVEGLELGEVLARAGAEVAGDEDVVVDERACAQASAPRTVRGAQGDIHPAVEHEVADAAQVLLVLAVGAVLVLHLHHEDVSTACDLTLLEDGHEGVVVGGNAGKELGVARARAHGAVREEPGGESAPLPLRADERRRADDGPETELGRLVQEASEGEPAREVELAGTGLVEVPGNVGLNGVEAHRLEVVEGVAPVRGVHPEVVDGPGEDAERFSVEQELIANLKGVLGDALVRTQRKHLVSRDLDSATQCSHHTCLRHNFVHFMKIAVSGRFSLVSGRYHLRR